MRFRRESLYVGLIARPSSRYDDYEIGLLGDLTRVSPEQVEAMLDAKLQEMKIIEGWIIRSTSSPVII